MPDSSEKLDVVEQFQIFASGRNIAAARKQGLRHLVRGCFILGAAMEAREAERNHKRDHWVLLRAVAGLHAVYVHERIGSAHAACKLVQANRSIADRVSGHSLRIAIELETRIAPGYGVGFDGIRANRRLWYNNGDSIICLIDLIRDEVHTRCGPDLESITDILDRVPRKCAAR